MKKKERSFPLPKPIELAKLAAILRPRAQNPTEALKVATEWYFETLLFLSSDFRKRVESLVERKRLKEKQRRAVETIKELAASPPKTVSRDEALRLVTNPGELAERLSKLPKEGEPLQKNILLLHKLPAAELKTERALRTNVLKAVLYTHRMHLDSKRVVGAFASDKVPLFWLESVILYKHERAKEKKRKYAKEHAKGDT